MLLRTAFFFAAFMSTAFAAVDMPDLSIVDREQQMKRQVEEKIQNDILDPIFGKGKAMTFVDIELDVISRTQEQQRRGTGTIERKGEAGPGSPRTETQFILPGVPKPKLFTSMVDKPEASQTSGEAAQEEKRLREERSIQKMVIKRFIVTILHETGAAREKLDLARQRILDVYSKYQLKPSQVIFRPTQFDVIEWWKDLFKPDVYVPLIFALLLLLFLLFLFGPVTTLMRAYIRTIQERPAAEVDVESKLEIPEREREPGMLGGMLGGIEGSLQQAKREEEEEMKKFEPFKYITEENLKRLAYLLRKEEPWLVAVVLSYLKPEFARQVLTALPAEQQAKVAIAAATVRQVSREQVMAIDTQIREKVDFVLGGVEHLTEILQEADESTRQNILEYLKNEKPAIYEKVRKGVVTFEDIPSFPDREMQTVVRELQTEDMAKALQGASPEILGKFFTNMSAGASALLKEAMEFQQELSAARVAEERQKVMDSIRSMEKEGKVSIRRKESSVTLEGLEEEVSEAEHPIGAVLGPAGLPSPQAQEYADYGISLYQSGKVQECMSYFQYALSLDPNLWVCYHYLGAAAYALGQTREAVLYFEKLLAHGPDPELKRWVEQLKIKSEM